MKCKYHNLPPNIIIKISAAIFLFIFTSLSFNACSTFSLMEKPAFIKVNGTQFELNGQPYYFEGANFWYAVYLGASGSIGDRPRLIRELDFLQSMGITNLRIIGASEQSYIGMALSPGIIKKPDDYNNDLLDGLDFLLSEMKKRNMYAVIFLTNTWKWSGGMSQYNTWAGGGAPQNEHYQWGLGNEMRGVDNFNSIYSSDTTTINILKDYAQKLNELDEKLKK